MKCPDFPKIKVGLLCVYKIDVAVQGDPFPAQHTKISSQTLLTFETVLRNFDAVPVFTLSHLTRGAVKVI